MKKIELTVVCGQAKPIIEALNILGVDDITISDVKNLWGEHMRPLFMDWCIPPIDYREKIEVVVEDDQTDCVIRIIQENIPKRKRSGFSPRPEYGEDIFISQIEQVVHI